jgi:hypothetical protein
MARTDPSSAVGDSRSIGLLGRTSPTLAGRRGDESDSTNDRGGPATTPMAGRAGRGMQAGTEGSASPPVAIGGRRP